MATIWAGLAPLILGSALVPVEIVITLMLLGTPARARAAGAWVTGMIAARLLQGVIFGMILHVGARQSAENGHRWIVSTVLLIAAILFLVTAVRELLGGDDPDAPPPKWMTMLDSITPAKALLLGAGIIVVAVKFWVFTFGAIGVIGDAGLERSASIAFYVAFVLMAVSPHLLIVGAAALFPARSKVLLDRALTWLQDHNRVIMVGIGLIFGVWFLIKALSGFGVL